jgi:fructose-1-phosphate kinase PfkB-like protein
VIVTLTVNPSFDRTVELVAPLERGQVQRAVVTGQEPGGNNGKTTGKENSLRPTGI